MELREQYIDDTMAEILLDPAAIVLPFLTVVLSLVLAQGLKLILDVLGGSKLSLSHDGGMPSAHAAIVLSLCMVILFEDGLSLLFLVTSIFSLIVLNDALGVRWETSKHSTFLNTLSEKKPFHIVGHKPLEVVIGSAIGIVVPVLVYAFLG